MDSSCKRSNVILQHDWCSTIEEAVNKVLGGRCSCKQQATAVVIFKLSHLSMLVVMSVNRTTTS
jgi:hypothetical protein